MERFRARKNWGKKIKQKQIKKIKKESLEGKILVQGVLLVPALSHRSHCAHVTPNKNCSFSRESIFIQRWRSDLRLPVSWSFLVHQTNSTFLRSQFYFYFYFYLLFLFSFWKIYCFPYKFWAFIDSDG